MTKVFELAGVTGDDVLAVDLQRGAKMVGVSVRHFWKQLDTNGGPIRTVRMGTRVLIPIQSLRDYLKPPAEPEPVPAEAKTEKKVREVVR